MSSKELKSDPFYASNQHVRRGERKFDEVKSLVNGFIERKPYTIERRNHATGRYVVACRTVDIPDDLNWDVIHIIERLRSSLDAAIVKIVEANGFGTSGVGFPFGGINRDTGKPDVFPNGRMTGKGGIAKKLTPDQWDFIQAQRPYPGGNDILWSINEVANAIKHRAEIIEILPTIDQRTQIGIGPAGNAMFIRESIIMPTDRDFILRDKERETVLYFTNHISFNQKVNIDVSVNVVFSDLFPLSHKNVLSTLNQQIRMTKAIVKGLKRHI